MRRLGYALFGVAAAIAVIGTAKADAPFPPSAEMPTFFFMRCLDSKISDAMEVLRHQPLPETAGEKDTVLNATRASVYAGCREESAFLQAKAREAFGTEPEAKAFLIGVWMCASSKVTYAVTDWLDGKSSGRANP